MIIKWETTASRSPYLSIITPCKQMVILIAIYIYHTAHDTLLNNLPRLKILACKHPITILAFLNTYI